MKAKPRKKTESAPVSAVFAFDDAQLLLAVAGSYDRNLARLEQKLGLTLTRRGNRLTLTGEAGAVATGEAALETLARRAELTGNLSAAEIDQAIRSAREGDAPHHPDGTIRTPRRLIHARTPTQGAYMKALAANDLVLGLGPAGTGKTYLAVAAAVAALTGGEVDRIVLSRPAVEAGERLGFLPGDMKEKVDPYLRPLYDALNDCLPAKDVAHRIETGEIEIAPLAFMRGRTLAHAFCILDEAQNATPMQMRMFLTRLGDGSRMAVTGDPSQSDLPRGQLSGLEEAVRVLDGVDGVAMVRFSGDDVVRHPLVTRIVRAYAAHDSGQG
jgi:phosphate starvation-inducible protein PhoH and related proteins